MFTAVARILGRNRRTVIFEYRRCGTTVDADAITCLTCDSREIARYEV